MTCEHKNKTPFFSIIMPSYLGQYMNAASGREWKIVRAVQSVIDQSTHDWELNITADGCKDTVEIIQNNFVHQLNCGKINLFEIPKQKLWSGLVRNTSIQNAKGSWIVYLDIDDLLSEDHLVIIKKGIDANPGMNWLWFNDLSWDKERVWNNNGVKEKGAFVEHQVNIFQKGQCGTSNIVHKASLQVRWPINVYYDQDWWFIQALKKRCDKFVKIETPEYCICHVPNLLDI